MKKYALIAVVGAGLLLIVLLARYSNAAPASQGGDGTPSVTLIQEIRSLRMALQDLAANNTKLQFAIERCRMQQRVVDQLTDQVNSLQSDLDSNEDLIRQLQENLKNTEAPRVDTEPQSKNDVETERRSILTSIEVNKTRNQRLEERQAQVEASLQNEKLRLSSLNEALDALYSKVTRQQAEQ